MLMPLWLRRLQLPFFSFFDRRGTRDSVDRAPILTLSYTALAEVLSASFLPFLLAVRRNLDTVLKMSRRCLVASCVLKPA